MAQIRPEQRSAMMRAVPSQGTEPELVVRRLAHRLGYRFRVHGRHLPGTPDLVFASRRKVIFVHGCFWHRHSCETGRRAIRTRSDFWEKKFARNVARDSRIMAALEGDGWQALILWECELGDSAKLARRLTSFLGPVGKVTRVS